MLSVVKNSSFLKPNFLCSNLNKFQIKNFRLGQAGEFLELPVTIEAQTIEIFIVHYVMGPCFKARLLYSICSNEIICIIIEKNYIDSILKLTFPIDLFSTQVEVYGCEKLSCKDINECMVENGFCEHTCINSIGGYNVRKIEIFQVLQDLYLQCACKEGYDLFTENGQGGKYIPDSESGEDNKDLIR